MTTRQNIFSRHLRVLSPRSLLKLLVVAFALQLQILAIASLWLQNGTVFVKRYFFAMDFHDFVQAAALRLNGLDPYSDKRFVTAPLSLLIGRAGLIWPQQSAHLFFLINLALLGVSLQILLRAFSIGKRAAMLIWAIAFSFYPVYFLLERGNLDMVMLFCVAVVISSRHPLVRALALGVSVNLKLYSVLLTFPFLFRRRWLYAIALFSSIVLFAMPYGSLYPSFVHSLLARGATATGTENLSPGLILGSIGKTSWGRLTYFCLWLGTLLFATRKFSKAPLQESLLASLPWMMSLPLQVYPYTGVLLLPMLIGHLRKSNEEHPSLSASLFFIGFGLVGIQQQALTDAFGFVLHSHRFFPFLNVLGTLAVMASIFTSADPIQHSISDRR